ncbi:MAG: DUF2868 domain-containing protein [Desulfobacula sp.]|uniref:DUF2868 domain-containing protein n=1 Tax=Desulfobacula sp. TaxID=2593537 RepID=UPI0025C69AD8|nr:DUF2868 domain-containing protein [Desulfobacula sp.]MCD4721578.1 DUF2868 domain-containing protein [Desulfobacula sp.]
MKIRLKDIIDLDYLISMDDALDSGEDIQSRAIKDRKIYHQCNSRSQTLKILLFSWLAFRKEEFFQNTDKKGLTLLPGRIFSSLYTWMVYGMIFSGGIAGISLVYSFLAYHGTRPINVAIFIALFIVLQVMLILFTLMLLVRRGMGAKNSEKRFRYSIVHTLVSSLFFDVLPKILKRVNWTIFKKSLDTLEYTSSLIRMKNREYRDLFFWPFFILTSVFAFSFSACALGGTFFRVVVSDMAFGWQSTLMTSSTRVYDIVLFIARPWSWFISESFTHPSLDQIEGSRIILKDGISVLATQDLISWWPFICLGILFYAVIPRGILIIAGVLAQRRALRNFSFDRPRFRQLIVRMQSPVLDIDANETPVDQVPVNQSMERNLIFLHDREIKETPGFKPDADILSQNALILAAKNVYSEKIIQKLIQGIEQHLFLDVKEMIGISFDYEDDADAVHQINVSDADQVILVHEVWQPPIRGLLHYITQIKAAMPEGKPLWILLTRDAGQKNLAVDNNDVNYDVWKKAIFKLENSEIVVKRFI